MVLTPLLVSLGNISAASAEVAISLAPTMAALPMGGQFGLLGIALAVIDPGGHLAKLPPFSFIRDVHDYLAKHHPYLKDLWKR
ncbi:hypothetical protein JNW90_07515 [Micromonospora sp. STR1s_5]|nr:hypothetical protein [Micromonospora sp. STR1s_5]